MKVRMRDTGMRLKARVNGRVTVRKVWTCDEPGLSGDYYVRLGSLSYFDPNASVSLAYFLGIGGVEYIEMTRSN